MAFTNQYYYIKHSDWEFVVRSSYSLRLLEFWCFHFRNGDSYRPHPHETESYYNDNFGMNKLSYYNINSYTIPYHTFVLIGGPGDILSLLKSVANNPRTIIKDIATKLIKDAAKDVTRYVNESI